MTQKEDEPAQAARGKASAVDLDNLEATQIVSLDDLKELENLELARVNAAEPAQRRRVIAAGIVLGLVLAAAALAVIFLRSGGH